MSSSPSVIVSFLYPRTSTSTFDLNYYVTSHIPTCKSLWEPLGMKSVYVLTIDDEKQEYAVQTVLIWEDKSSWEKASNDPSMSQLVNDMKNFTNVTPVALVGSHVG